MAKTQPETFIRKAVVDALRLAGWFVYYNMQMGFGQHKGLADLTAMKDGQVVFVEIKTETGRQSPWSDVHFGAQRSGCKLAIDFQAAFLAGGRD